MSEFQVLVEHWLSAIEAGVREHIEHIVDSYPVILVKVVRSGHTKSLANCKERVKILLERAAL